MKSIILTVSILLFTAIATAQIVDYSDLKKNGVYFSGHYFNSSDGPGYLSINYERVFGKKKKTLISLGIYPYFETDEAWIFFPIIISRITSPLEKHHFEYGIGAAPSIYYDANNSHKKLWSGGFFIMAPIMYRYQKNKGLLLRGGVNLILGYGGLLLHPSISIGYKF